MANKDRAKDASEPTNLNENEGEGSTTAAKKYLEGVEDYVKTHDPEKVIAADEKKPAADHAAGA